jgi:16S rRNA (uracil1498-N3)-methyltransferase
VPPRFPVEDPGEATRVTLSREDSRHALRVLRLGPGSPVTLFDGTNREHRGRIASVEDGLAAIEIEATEVVDREPNVAVTVAAAVPKGRRLEDLVRACAELGARTIVPLFTERTVVKDRPGRGGKLDRLRRVSVEASKQCGRNRVTHIADPCPFDGLAALAADHDLALLATTARGAVPLSEALRTPLQGGKILLAIGPEGGFTPAEVEAAGTAGFVTVTLGRPRYRVATAAIAGLAMIVHHHS